MRYDINKVPQYTHWGNYCVDVEWTYLEEHIAHYEKTYGLDLDPPYQRVHVWTEAQQSAYVEFILRNGHGARDLLFNCPNFNSSLRGTGVCELVDGKQRLHAIRKFMRGELGVFVDGSVFSNERPLFLRDFVGNMRFYCGVKWHVNDLRTRREVLQWYLDINAGGTPHTQGEIERVRGMLAEEQ